MPLTVTTSESHDTILVSAPPSYHPPSNGSDENDAEGVYSAAPMNFTGAGSDVRWGHWGLDAGMRLPRTAADFYLLYDLSLEGKDEGRFAELMDWILNQFTHYTDMAVGGELRHAKGRVKAKSEIAVPLRKALYDGTLPSNRHSAWHNWKYFRNKYGTLALKWADECFRKFQGGGYGGPKWGTIAKVLWMYETGELTPVSFIDTCWSLEHNGGAYFNKAWNTNGMKSVLDAVLHDNFSYVRLKASPTVRQLHVAVMGED